MERTQMSDAYSILFNGITEAQRLIKQGLVEESQTLLMNTQRNAEEVFINSLDVKGVDSK